MKNKIVILLTLFLLISCSNLQEKPRYRDKETSLNKFIENFKVDLGNNDFPKVETYFEDTFMNRRLLSEIEDINFSQIKIMSTEFKVHKDTASNIVAFIFMDEVKYFRCTYVFKNEEWKIRKIKDGR